MRYVVWYHEADEWQSNSDSDSNDLQYCQDIANEYKYAYVWDNVSHAVVYRTPSYKVKV